MLQSYVSKHCHPDTIANAIIATTSATAGSAAPLKTSTGVAISAIDANYNFNVPVTGIAGVSAFYVAQLFETVSGASDLHIVCSAAAQVANLPPDAIVIPFIIDRDLSATATQAFALSDPSLRLLPVEQSGFGTATQLTVTMRDCFPVPNETILGTPRYFGLLLIGTWGATGRPISGALSLREGATEMATFMPNK